MSRLVAQHQAIVAAGAPALARERTLRLGHLANEDNVWHLASVYFGEQLSELTDGRITVEVFPNESLGREIDMINGMQLGTVDMTITGESLQNWTPMAALLAIPYGYQSLEDMDEIASGDLVNTDIALEAMPERMGWMLRLLGAIITCGFALYLIEPAMRFVNIGRMQTSPVLGIRMNWSQATVIGLLAGLAVFSALRVLEMLTGRSDGRPEPLKDLPTQPTLPGAELPSARTPPQ